MYLSDKDIKNKLAEMHVSGDNPEYPFQEDLQIQPCSIDLRLSNVFWETTGPKSIDLRRSRLLELAPRRYWKKKVLQKGEHITLKPGKLLLGRTYERFNLPQNCSGKIEGRSSFARMGLSVHCTGDFINPGWSGHMPLQLFNHSSNSIKVFPYLPICQLMLIAISSETLRKYGDQELQSKYMDDDGGPSYWWRDKRIKSLQQTFTEADISLNIQDRILAKIGVEEPELIERFEKFIDKIPAHDFENADELLGLFVKTENKAMLMNRIAKNICVAAFPTLASVSLGSLFIQPLTFLHYALFGLTGISIVLFVCALKSEPRHYLKNVP